MTRDMFADFDATAPPPAMIPGSDVVTEGNAGSWATFSVCRTFRYLLGRQWEPLAPWLVVGMLNPSKANADRPDPTVTRMLGFARRDGFGGLLVWNAMALVSTDPRGLLTAPDPYGPRNEDAIRAAIVRPGLAKCVVAWGRPANKKIAALVARSFMIATCARPLWRFGEPTKDGHPRHPLYLKGSTPIVRHV